MNQTQTLLNTKNIKEKPATIIKKMAGRVSYPKLLTNTFTKKAQTTLIEP